MCAARRFKFWTAVWFLCAAAVPAAAQPADDDLVGLAAASNDDEPGAFVYVGFRSGFILGNRVLRRVEGGYHSWVRVEDIDLARRFGSDEHLRRPYRALDAAAGPTNGGFEGLWLPGRDAERFGLAWSIDSLWVRHVTDDNLTGHVPNPVGLEYTVGAAGAAAVYASVSRTTYGGGGLVYLAGGQDGRRVFSARISGARASWSRSTRQRPGTQPAECCGPDRPGSPTA